MTNSFDLPEEQPVTIEVIKENDDDITIAFAGNPNVGKSTIFNELTGMRQHTGNWPGKTVEIAQGNYKFNDKNFVLVDLPGTYSLLAHSTEEEVARDFILHGNPEATVIVCDATSLERNLNLVLQIMTLTDHVVVCVNLLDEAKRKKITVDLKKLQYLLGVPVVGTSATHKQGIDELMTAVDSVVIGSQEINPYMFDALRSMMNDNDEQKVEAIMDRASVIANDVVSYENANYDKFDRKLDKLFTSKLTGIPIMLLFMLFIFWFTIQGANVPSAMLADFLFSFKEPLIHLTNFMPSWLQGVIVDGLFEVTATVISVMLPPMAIFFPLFTLLEDFGYLPRIAFNLDNQFQQAGACGKQALSMCMGFGCNAAGVTGARIIDSLRERLIAIITNNFVPCNGRFPILIAITSIFFVQTLAGITATFESAIFLTLAILLGVGMTLLISKLLSRTILKGMPSAFTLELPPYRKPRIGQVLVRSLLDRTLFVLGRAIKIAAPVGVLIWILANIHVGDVTLLQGAINFLDPFARLMGLDGVILMAFILGFPANEIVVPCMVMGYLATSTITDYTSLSQFREILLSNGWTWITALCMILFTLFHWPCGTTLLTIKKETQSWKWTAISFLVPTVTGIVITIAVNGAANLIGIV